MKNDYLIFFILFPQMMYSQEKITQEELGRYITELRSNEIYSELETDVYTYLPISNSDFTYLYFKKVGTIVERDNKNNTDIYFFKNYQDFRDYYLNLNKRIVLPLNIEGFYEDESYLLAKNYISDKNKILKIENNIEFYKNYLFNNIFENNLVFIDSLNQKMEDIIRIEVEYSGSELYEIPLLVFLGELYKKKYGGEWSVFSSENILGELFYYPDLVISDVKINLWSRLREVLYNERDNKIFNFRYVITAPPCGQDETEVDRKE